MELSCTGDSRPSVCIVACVEGLCWLYLASYLPDISPLTLSTGAATFCGKNRRKEKKKNNGNS